MIKYNLGEVEMRFCDIVWQHEPLLSGELVKLAEAALSWKKSTTYTILRKLCQKNILQNENGTVSSLVSKVEYKAIQSEKFVEETFSGSLPSFLAAFTMRKKLSKAEITKIQQFIDRHGEE